jgi:hypothetical protein
MGATTLLLAGSAGMLASHAAAASTPPWESGSAKDANEVGTLVLYNSSGAQVTSGSVTSTPIAAYIVGSHADASHQKATAYMYTPKNGTAPGAWPGEQLSLSTSYPVTSASAPSAVKNAAGPVVTGHSGDESLATYIDDVPNKDTTHAGYVNAYQLRVKTSTNGTYQALDLVVSNLTRSGGRVSGGTWSETYPGTGKTPPTHLRLKNTKKPKLSGPHKVGKKEKVSKGSWRPRPSHFSYQWYLGSHKIKHATKKAYKLIKKDKGKKISCKVTATRHGYASASAKSKAVKVKK